MEKSLSKCIEAYKLGDNNSLLDIDEKMKPLAKKYSSKLQTYMDFDDAMQEFSVTFIECARSIKDWSSEDSCLKYFKDAVIHHYCALRDDAKEKIHWEINDEGYLNIRSEKCNEYDVLILKYSLVELENLTEKKKIIICLLYKGFSCQEIAKEMKVSRQYIYQIRNQLKAIYEKIVEKFT